MAKQKDLEEEIKEIEQELDTPTPAPLKRFAVQFNIDYHGTNGKIMDPDRITQPDMSLTVRQLVDRYTRAGEPIPNKDPYYFDIKVPVIKDLTDVERFREETQQRLDDVNAYLKQEIADRKAAEEEAAADKLKAEQREQARETGTPAGVPPEEDK